MACPAGYMGTGIGKTTQANGCSLCSAGTYSDTAGSPTCTTCSAGYYNTGEGNTSCKACEKGYYCTGGTNKIACPAGYMGTGTAKTTQANGCSACANGKYSDSEASTTCSTCASGSYNVGTGNTTCTTDTGTLCSAGSYYNKTTNSCETCPAGYYCPAGASDKIECLEGTYTDTTGNTTCKTCSPGTYNTTTGNTRCSTCENGYYCTGGKNKTACPAGSKGTGTGKKTQENGCTLCPAGTYSDALGSTTCSSCLAGTYTLTSGHASCSPCESGYYCTGGTNRTACAAGSKGTGTNKTTLENGCTLCPAGTYSDSEGSAICTSCSITTYNTGTGNTSCTRCAPGTYNLGEGNTKCTICPENLDSLLIDQKIKVQCSLSPGGTVPVTVDYEVVASGINSSFDESGYIVSTQSDGIYITIARGKGMGSSAYEIKKVSRKDDTTVEIIIDFENSISGGAITVQSKPYVRIKINDTKYTNFIVKTSTGKLYNEISPGLTM